MKEIARTLYMVSYLHHLNEHSQDIYRKFEDTEHEENFKNLWNKKIQVEKDWVSQYIPEEMEFMRKEL